MIKLIGSIFRYSLLVLVILVLSHIIEIQGVTISQHVLNGMHFFSGYSPKKQAEKIQDEYKSALEARMKDLNKIDSDISAEDQKALNQVIQNSQRKK